MWESVFTWMPESDSLVKIICTFENTKKKKKKAMQAGGRKEELLGDRKKKFGFEPVVF